MTATAREIPTTPEAFIAWENRQKARYELIEGVVRMITGGTFAHSRVAANIIAGLHARLSGRPCSVHGSDLKLRSPTDAVMYPDALVHFGAMADETTQIDDPFSSSRSCRAGPSTTTCGRNGRPISPSRRCVTSCSSRPMPAGSSWKPAATTGHGCSAYTSASTRTGTRCARRDAATGGDYAGERIASGTDG